MIRWLQRLAALPRLLAAYTLLRADVEASMRDPAIVAALDRLRTDPAVAPVVPRLSAEWRAVEQAFQQMR